MDNVEICEVFDPTLGFLVVETILQGSLVLVLFTVVTDILDKSHGRFL